MEPRSDYDGYDGYDGEDDEHRERRAPVHVADATAGRLEPLPECGATVGSERHGPGGPAGLQNR